MIAFLFPGQGAQTPGFLHRLGGGKPHPAIARTLAEASDVLGANILQLDEADALKSTVAVQVTLVTAGVAAARALAEEGIEPEAVAGLSVGAYGAAVVCGAVGFADALRLVRLRASLMQDAYPHGYGMLAVLGLNESEIARAIADSGADAYIGNLNAPRQIVVSGSDAALAKVRDIALSRGARRAERLSVSVPSHCALLEDAANRLIEAARDVRVETPRIAYVGNRGARVLRHADAVREDLATNLRHPVRWHDSTIALSELGANVFVEMPPGQTLTQLAAEALPDASAIAADASTVASLAARVRAAVRRARD
ncbi:MULTISPECIES: malonate decarboxylase subunit epsilon [Caballeronia]|uniref:malonate decarboxylase subunit epsilon n=1 Tax=Caballeronia TaxID=1827195 RepID=UPI0002388A28|nr:MULTISPECIES: malonate decarboxylase subunit epsilon [unclassified Caballeronia]AET89565.1 malonate decarboxylase, epsilon subunit [Burkholderia sp. YI23]MCE4541371.1 malonate decarboxylase subunit epsilon [Caballeronia sp. PC1]MCE4569585.1 malonate decarboxylase subunit epsilon [Caballeronia sp. CLC5]BAO86830.1 malonyl coA-acyl carrier protein transacylase [Burkholderia sp. RPE67]